MHKLNHFAVITHNAHVEHLFSNVHSQHAQSVAVFLNKLALAKLKIIKQAGNLLQTIVDACLHLLIGCFPSLLRCLLFQESSVGTRLFKHFITFLTGTAKNFLRNFFRIFAGAPDRKKLRLLFGSMNRFLLNCLLRQLRRQCFGIVLVRRVNRLWLWRRGHICNQHNVVRTDGITRLNHLKQ